MAIAGACVALLAAITLWNGVSVIDGPTDVFVMLNGGYRILIGQTPHVDYSDPVGVLMYALVAAGMGISGVGAQSLMWATLLLLVPSVLWGGWVAYNRLGLRAATIFVVFLALLCVATRPIGYEPTTHTYAMFYNRIGWVLLAILVVQAFIPRANMSARQTWVEAFSIGALAALLFYAKMTYGLVALEVVVLALLLRPDLRAIRALAAMLTGYVVACLAVWLTTGAAFSNYVHDIAVAAQAQSTPMRLERLKLAIKNGLVPLALLSLLWVALIGRKIWVDRALRWESIAVTLQFAVLCAAGLFITIGNTGERAEVPIYALAGFILWHNRGVAPADGWRRYANAAALAVPLMLVLFIGAREIWSIADTTMWRSYRISRGPVSQQLDAPRLRDFVVPDSATHYTQYWIASDFPAHINDGLALLRRHVGPSDKLFVFAESDPFSIALDLQPARGGPFWSDRYFSYDYDTYPNPDHLFGEVTYVMIPLLTPADEGCCREVFDDFTQFYSAYLAEHYVEAERSQDWVLLKRR